MGAPEWTDPHGIIPEQFKERYSDCNTADDALRKAELRESSTPPSEQPVCPECGTRRVWSKPGREQTHRVNTEYRCYNAHHFDVPADPEPMTHYEPDHSFEWLSPDELADADARGMNAPFAGLDDETRVEIAIRLYKPWSEDGPSYRELADLFPHGRAWIGERVREWKRGEHRELVERPTPTVDETAGADAIATDGGEPRSRWAAYGGMD